MFGSRRLEGHPRSARAGGRARSDLGLPGHPAARRVRAAAPLGPGAIRRGLRVRERFVAADAGRLHVPRLCDRGRRPVRTGRAPAVALRHVPALAGRKPVPRPPRQDPRRRPRRLHAPSTCTPASSSASARCPQILETVDENLRNRGMGFHSEMVPFTGGTYRVLRRIERIVHEKTGKMVHLKNDAVILEDVVCQARYINNCRRFCPRRVYLYFREIWLERVAAPGRRQSPTRGGGIAMAAARPAARVLLVSLRRLNSHAAWCSNYEFEDVIQRGGRRGRPRAGTGPPRRRAPARRAQPRLARAPPSLPASEPGRAARSRSSATTTSWSSSA